MNMYIIRLHITAVLYFRAFPVRDQSRKYGQLPGMQGPVCSALSCVALLPSGSCLDLHSCI